MRWRRLVRDRRVQLAAAFLGAAAVAAGISSAVRSDPAEGPVAVASGEAIPMLTPVAIGPTPPVPPGEAEAGAAGPLSPVSSGPPPAGPTAATGAPIDHTAGTEGFTPIEPDGDGEEEPGGEGPSDPPGPVDPGEPDPGGLGDPLPPFVDECAGAEPGAEPVPGCPDGIGGTVAALTDPWPQWVIFFPGRPEGGWSSRCPPPPTGEGEMAATVVTLNPGTVHLEYWHANDPTEVFTIERSTADESDPEHRLWAGWFEDGTLNSENDKRVQYCLVLEDLQPGLYRYRVSSTDVFGSRADDGGHFTVPDERTRPPVTISPANIRRVLDDTRVDVRVPVRSERNERAVIRAFPQTGDDSPTCSDVDPGEEAEDRPGWRPTESFLRDVAPGTLRDPGYPWDPTYDQVDRSLVSLEEGATSAVCIWWVAGARASFEVDQVTEREVHLVTTPNRYRFRATLESVWLVRDVEARSVRIRFPDVPGCTTQLPPVAIRATRHRPHGAVFDEPLCDLTDVGDVGQFGETFTIGLRGLPGGPEALSRIDASRRPCDGGACEPVHTDWYRLNIPAEREVRRLCGPGASCEYEDDESVGTAMVRVDLVDGPSNGAAGEYVFGTPEPFTGEDEPRPEPPPHPQLDELTASVGPVDGQPNSLRVVAHFDRDVRVLAHVPADEEDPSFCLRPGADPRAASTDMQRDHTFVLDGLCAGHWYNVALRVTDGDGAVWHFGSRWLDLPDPHFETELLTGGVPPHERLVRVELEVLEHPDGPTPGALDLPRAVVTLDGSPVLWCVAEGDRVSDLPPGCYSEVPYCGPSSRALLLGTRPTERLFADDVEVVVVAEGRGAAQFADGGCEGRGPSASTRAQATVPVDDLGGLVLASPPDDDLRIAVRIESLDP